jgi:hypothetical protein
MDDQAAEVEGHLSKADHLIANGKDRRALAQLWIARAEARGNSDAIREVLAAAAALEKHVSSKKRAELDELVEVLHRDMHSLRAKKGQSPSGTVP